MSHRSASVYDKYETKLVVKAFLFQIVLIVSKFDFSSVIFRLMSKCWHELGHHCYFTGVHAFVPLEHVLGSAAVSFELYLDVLFDFGQVSFTGAADRDIVFSHFLFENFWKVNLLEI